MNPAEFCTVLGDINEKYVAQAHTPRRAGGRTTLRWLAAAACLCLALGVGFWAAKNLKTTPVPIITHYASDSFSGSQYQFLPPAAGKTLFYAGVENALTQYGRQAKYLLTMDVFQDGEMLQVNDLGGEFRRLGALGYDLRIAAVEELDGDQIIVHHIVAGLFTEEQLRNFDADPHYGYCFGFPASPDGTALSPADFGFDTDAAK